MDTIYLCCEK